MTHKKSKLAAAMLVCLTMLATSYLFVYAAPVEQQEAPRMSLLMAVIIGLLYYASLSPWFANLGFTVMYRPLVAGTLVGLVMGRPAEGIAIGANINILYLGWIGAGGTMPGDPGLAGYLGTALALGSGLGAQGALAVAAPLGLLGGLTWSLRMSMCSIIPHWADKFAEAGDIKGVARSNYIYSQPLLLILYGLPVALAAYLGAPAVSAGLGWIAQNAIWVMNGLYAASGMLAGLGIAMNLKFLLKGNVWQYFLLGFLVVSLAGGNVNLLVFALIGLALAFMHVLFTMGENPPPSTNSEPRKSPGLLTKKDVFGSFVRWLFMSHACYNWERMHGVGFAHSMTPIIAKLYKTKEDISAALKRHLVFFNTQPDIGGIINGITIAMEEERAAGADIDDNAINAVKTGLMGPMAGIGDTVQQGIIIPIALAIAINIATGGNFSDKNLQTNIMGPIFFLVFMAAFVWGVGWWLYWQGYQQGRSAVINILQSGALKRLIAGAEVLGNFIMGALAVSFVKLSTPLAFKIGGTAFKAQEILDQFMPNLLPLLLVLVIWWLVARKNISATRVMFFIIAFGIITAIPIWPGINEAGEAIWVGLLGS